MANCDNNPWKKNAWGKKEVCVLHRFLQTVLLLKIHHFLVNDSRRETNNSTLKHFLQGEVEEPIVSFVDVMSEEFIEDMSLQEKLEDERYIKVS